MRNKGETGDMTPAEALDTLLKSYRRYYNIERDVEPPFSAEAAFHSHDEQYFLVRSAKLAEAEAHEYAFFAVCDLLDLALAQTLERCAWERGVSRAKPGPNHRSTDVTLVLLAERIAPEAKRCIEQIKRYQSYRFTLHGWSHYRVIALETSTGALSCNRRGQDLKKLFGNIHSSKER